MEETTKGAPGAPRASASGGGSLGRMLITLLDRWRVIAVTILTALIVAGAVRLIIPRKYAASTLIVLAQNQQDPRGQMLSQVPSMLLGFMSPSSDAKLVAAVIASRSLADSMQNRFDGVKITPTQNKNDGSITITIFDRDPRRALAAARAYPQLLNAILGHMTTETGVRKTRILRQQVALARQNLDESEAALVKFEHDQHAPAIEQQAQRTVDAAAGLQQQIAQRQVALAMLKRVATPDNPQVRGAEAELSQLRGQLNSIAQGGGEGQILVSLQQGPELKARSMRLLGEYTKDQQVYLALMGGLTQAEINGADDMPELNVIDEPVLPTEPAGAGLPTVLALALVLGSLMGIVLALSSDWLDRARKDARYAPIFAAWSRFRADTRRVLPFGAPAPAAVAMEAHSRELGSAD